MSRVRRAPLPPLSVSLHAYKAHVDIDFQRAEQSAGDRVLCRLQIRRVSGILCYMHPSLRVSRPVEAFGLSAEGRGVSI